MDTSVSDCFILLCVLCVDMSNDGVVFSEPAFKMVVREIVVKISCTVLVEIDEALVITRGSLLSNSDVFSVDATAVFAIVPLIKFVLAFVFVFVETTDVFKGSFAFERDVSDVFT